MTNRRIDALLSVALPSSAIYKVSRRTSSSHRSADEQNPELRTDEIGRKVSAEDWSRLHLFKKFNQHSRPAFRIGSHKHVLLHNPKRLARVLSTLIKELTRIYGHKIASHWLNYFFAEQLDVELPQPEIDSRINSDDDIERLSRFAIRNSGLKRTKWFQAFWLW